MGRRKRAPMLTIAVSNLKGGVGKSTIALNVASTLHHAGHKTLVVDLDSQGTCRAWASVAADAGRDGPPVVAVDGRSLRRDLPRIASGVDVVVLDTPPRIGAEVRAAMLVADLVLLPITPGAADVWALRETVDVFEEAKGLKPELVARIVLNRAGRTALSTVTKQAIQDLAIPALDASLSERVAFGEATARGQGVVQYEPEGKAAAEVAKLVKEALGALES